METCRNVEAGIPSKTHLALATLMFILCWLSSNEKSSDWKTTKNWLKLDW